MPKNEIYYEIARNKQRNNTECWLPIAGVFSCPWEKHYTTRKVPARIIC